jgi:hypothetical protein
MPAASVSESLRRLRCLWRLRPRLLQIQNHVQTQNADLASLAAFAAVSEYRVPTTMVRRGQKPKIVVTTADGTASLSRPRSFTCKHEQFRQFAFATGRRHLVENRLGQVPLARIIEELNLEFRIVNPSAVSSKNSEL